MGAVRRSRSSVFTGALVVAVLVGCANDTTPGPGPATSSPSTTATGTVRPAVDMPDAPVGRQARWVLDQLEHADGPSADAARGRFTAEFLAEVPPEQVSGVFDQLRPAGPWVPVDLDAVGDDAVVRLHDGDGQPWRMVISVGPEGSISTLYIRPERDEAQTAQSWAEVHEQLTALGADVGLLAARVVDGRCEPITEIGPHEPRPMASIFKLYVLGAVADAVEEGTVRWGDQLTITDDTRSLPSGELQDQPNGSQVSVSQAAAGMIAISDNTASDMLAALVGRDAVESAMAGMGHTEPGLNEPFLTTRELFTLGWGPEASLDQWREADESERRRILQQLPPGVLTVTGGDVEDPSWNAGVDWFGSAHDVCAAMLSLHDRHESPEDPDALMLRTILGHNRGVSIDATDWPYVAYKGGSAPGVVSGSWYAERSDGERFVYVMQAASDDAAALEDHSGFFGLAEDAFTLLAEE